MNLPIFRDSSHSKFVVELCAKLNRLSASNGNLTDSCMMSLLAVSLIAKTAISSEHLNHSLFEGKLNMIYLVSIQGKMYWSLINGIVTPKRQLTFMARARKEMKPIKPVLLRTKKGFFQFNDKYRYTNISKVYPVGG